jgi:Protein of unknown function (DUF3443)
MSTVRLGILLLFSTILLSGCGGGIDDVAPAKQSVTPATPTLADNEVAVKVDSGPAGGRHNMPYVSVSICEQGSRSNCKTIDHIQVDTGSTGLRILANALTPAVSAKLLPVKVSNTPLLECMQYLDSYIWGPVKLADVQIGQKIVSGMQIQIIGDSTYPESTTPSSCSSTGIPTVTQNDLGSNGVLGIGHAQYDCGSACEQNTNKMYYTCSIPSSCQKAGVPNAQQVQNPIGLFQVDNNGSALKLDAVNNGVGTNIAGKLIFGINTQTNNQVATGASILSLSADNGYYLTAQMQGNSYSEFAIDSGTTDWVFDDNGTMAKCSNGYYCPSSTQSFIAIITDKKNTSVNINFMIANEAAQLGANGDASAFDSWGLSASDALGAHTTFLAGFPFFYGKTVWTALEGKTISGQQGPFVAFK